MSAPNELSFLPDDYLAAKARRRTNLICAGLFAVVMAAIGSAFTMTERAMHDVQAQHDSVDREFAEAARRIAQVQQMQQKQRTMAHQAELTSALLEKVPRSFLLAEITNALPAGVSLTDFVLEAKKKVAPAPAAPSGAFTQKSSTPATPDPASVQPQQYEVLMKLGGVAPNDVQVSMFITRLNASKLLRDVNLIVTESFVPVKDEQPLRKFSIEMAINPDASVQSQNDKTGTVAVEIK